MVGWGRRRGGDGSARSSRDQPRDALGRVPLVFPAMSRVVNTKSEPRASAASEIRRGTRRISPPPYPTQSAGYFVSVRGGGWGSYLGDAGLDVAGVGGGHRLADDGVIGSHLDVADGDGPVGSNRGCEARSAAGPSARKSARDDAPVGTAVACVGRITRSCGDEGRVVVDANDTHLVFLRTVLVLSTQ